MFAIYQDMRKLGVPFVDKVQQSSLDRTERANFITLSFLPFGFTKKPSNEHEVSITLSLIRS